MSTTPITISAKDGYEPDLRRAVDALRDGAVVVFPTETVYGVGVIASSRAAVERLRSLRGSRSRNPLTVHIPRRADAARFVQPSAARARRLSRKGWPGPIAMVCGVPDPAACPIAHDCDADTLAELYSDRTISLRCPDHPIAAALVDRVGQPVVATSAGAAGGSPPVDLASALSTLEGRFDVAIDGGRTKWAAASTVVEIQGGGWSLRRVGAIDERTIRRLITSEILFVCTGNSCRSPMAEYLFRAELAKRLGLSAEGLAEAGYVAASAGSFAGTGGRMSSGTVVELARRGIDGSAHCSQPLTVERIQRAERIYAMSQEHVAAVLDLVPSAAERVSLLDAPRGVADPIGGGAEDYRRCAEQIEAAVRALAEEFADEDRRW